jgi:hypothetical protein
MYKINFNGRYDDTTGCHLKIVERDSLQSTLLSLLNAGMVVHAVSEIR